jgi:uncharacterized damage-inducible protein DinB
MLPHAARGYLLNGLVATPIVIDHLLRDSAESDYDITPDPERYTIRWQIAHLADWEDIWLERMTVIRTQDNPTIPNRDPDEAAEKGKYDQREVAAEQARFRQGRERLVAFLQGLTDEDWQRSGSHTKWGPMTIEDLTTLVIGHDGYHTRQLSEWLDYSRAR